MNCKVTVGMNRSRRFMENRKVNKEKATRNIKPTNKYKDQSTCKPLETESQMMQQV